MSEVDRRGFIKKAAVAAAVLGVETRSACRPTSAKDPAPTTAPASPEVEVPPAAV